MKKWIIVIIVLILILLTSIIVFINNNNTNTINIDVISDYLEINISKEAKVEYKDKHDNFFNEGYSIIKIKDSNLLNKIENSSNWKKNDNEYTSKISKIIDNMSKDYSKISNINNYYWIYKHNYRSNNIKYIEDMDKNIETFSYLVGLYDIDNDILYYYHMDM